ncbi:SAM-dependent methyltransferase [Dokdonia sp. Dokd-P16]|uniref:class I SAM-dependent methyltransferase n=1 Tax=Dokdonia sp. Dokd-P16 TaxID=2173169 RepID=UPI000D549F3C|nr:class I SAM-dependent methyltransferase [Dokdonia sp. Dokd-P16]AWH74375.1 SAM-dependent methyltransferase [Dokdonia sp. Dokd-P16]
MSKDNISVKSKKPWPTKKAMEQVYDLKLWGAGVSAFYSGEGSHHPEIVVPYVEAVTAFLSSFEEPLVVCDLGCGDFNIGRKLISYTERYTGVDIVEDLIAHNEANFKNEGLSFKCLDIAAEELPIGDCVILRQVLQHLSNREIASVVDKLTSFKYVILTEHLPNGDFTPNQDIISGQGTRLKKNSGVQLLMAPFDMKVVGERELSVTYPSDGKGRIVTTLYKMF